MREFRREGRGMKKKNMKNNMAEAAMGQDDEQ